MSVATHRDQHVLYVTAEEKNVLSGLPSSAFAEWKVEDETVTFQDSDEKMKIRMRNLHVNHPALKAIQLKAKTHAFTPKEVEQLADNIDLTGLTEHDVLELAFAWGPSMFTTMIAAALPTAKTADDAQDIAQLIHLRHGLLLAMNR